MVARGGQVALYLLMAIIAIFLLALLNVDTFLSVRTKNRLQNGGDAAALAAARMQGELINEIGKLNVEHICAAADGDKLACDDIELQLRRLLLIAPLRAIGAANKAAKANGLPVTTEYGESLREHAAVVRSLYANGGGGPADPYPPSYPGAWQEYAAALEAEAGSLAMMPMNLQYYSAPGQHMILNPDFYKAIAGRDWCWFYFNNEQVLNNYSSYHDWPDLSEIPLNSTENSEIFSLNLTMKHQALADTFSFGKIEELGNIPPNTITPEGTNLFKSAGQAWVFFDKAYWRPWSSGRTFYVDGGARELPTVGPVKEEYNISGCWAVCGTHNARTSLTTDGTHNYSWSAAAKPFGVLDDGRPVTDDKYFVRPCMTAVRLVPTDSVASADAISTADPAWVRHRRKHIEPYLQGGPNACEPTCWYCKQLKRWENDYFRQSGAIWLKYHSRECIRPVGSGASKTGGTTHAH